MPDFLKPPENQHPEQEEINKINESEYIKRIKAKNKKNLIKLDFLERERIAHYIKDLYTENITKHRELCDKIDEYDDIYRMKRNSRPNDDEDTPNYRTPLSTVTLEVIHANEMNVFFTPNDIMRVLPTESGDIPKIQKLTTFGNWSMKNEMNIFENCDRLFHASGKNGETPYIVHWVKEYGTEIKIEPVMNPANPSQPLIDDVTKEVVTQERETPKLLYNGPRFEIFSRKDLIIPKDALNDKIAWKMRIIRKVADDISRGEQEGKYYDNTFEEIGGWGGEGENTENLIKDKEGNEIPMSKTGKIFIEFYGKMRIDYIKEGENGEEGLEELEDEFIAMIEIVSETLCFLKKNKFPLKMCPMGMDEFIPDDEGRMSGTGVMEFMDPIQKSYDALHNQYLYGTIQANNPIIFFAPTGNMRDEPIKVKGGYAYPSSDPNSMKEVKFSPPDQSLREMMEEVRNFAQLLFGISDYSAGIESQIDPTAPAKKVEIVVAQGNVRLNLIIKRKNKTLKDIFKRWFLLYQANMPPNKFMRIAGENRDNPWKFEAISMTDFALNSIPDFELTGNVLNANKTLEAQKALGVYQALVNNFFFMPQTQQGLQSLHALTKWLLDKLDETGISNFLPPVKGANILTPEEENARFLQGDEGEPEQSDDHIYHIKIHSVMMLDPIIPEDTKKKIIKHIQLHTNMLKEQVTQQSVMSRFNQAGGQGGQNGPGGGAGGQGGQAGQGGLGPMAGGEGTQRAPANILQGQPGLGRPASGAPFNMG